MFHLSTKQCPIYTPRADTVYLLFPLSTVYCPQSMGLESHFPHFQLWFVLCAQSQLCLFSRRIYWDLFFPCTECPVNIQILNLKTCVLMPLLALAHNILNINITCQRFSVKMVQTGAKNMGWKIWMSTTTKSLVVTTCVGMQAWTFIKAGITNLYQLSLCVKVQRLSDTLMTASMDTRFPLSNNNWKTLCPII